MRGAERQRGEGGGEGRGKCSVEWVEEEEEEEEEAEAEGEGQGGREPSEGAVIKEEGGGKDEEVILNRLMAAQMDSVEAQQKLQTLEQTISILKSTSNLVQSANTTQPMVEGGEGSERGTQGGEEGVGEIVFASSCAVDDPTVLIPRERGGQGESYLEPMQPSDAGETTPSVSTIHTVGEIMGGESFAAKLVGSSPDNDTDLTCGHKAGEIGAASSAAVERTAPFADFRSASAATNTELISPSQLQPAVATTDGSFVPVEEHFTPILQSQVLSAGASIMESFPLPSSTSSSSVSTATIKTARPKRQLAASFTRDTS